MAGFNTPIPVSQLHRINEGSGLRSVRDKDSLGLHWKKTNITTKQSGSDNQVLAKLMNEVGKLKRRQTGYMMSQPSMHPFKIYQPSNYASFSTGITFLDPTSGVGTVCNIDATKPTDFTATPPTVNPTTDAWRFWAVRSGCVEVRTIYSFSLSRDTNWAYCEEFVENTDGVGTRFSGQTEYDDPAAATVLSPLVIAGNPGPDGRLNFLIWIKIRMDASPGDWFTVSVAAATSTDDAPYFPSSGPDILQVGIVFTGEIGFDDGHSTYGIPLIVNQQKFDHFVNRYPVGNGNFGSGGVMNFRGVWDEYMPEFIPDDLDSQVFYPGDCVAIVNQLDLGGGIIIYTTSTYQFVGESPDFWPAGGPGAGGYGTAEWTMIAGTFA